MFVVNVPSRQLLENSENVCLLLIKGQIFSPLLPNSTQNTNNKWSLFVFIRLHMDTSVYTIIVGYRLIKHSTFIRFISSALSLPVAFDETAPP